MGQKKKWPWPISEAGPGENRRQTRGVEMSATSDQISKDIESISGISSETSMASGEVTKASQELARLGTDLQGISQQFEL
jgi:methyl-accepting chemotaxis protein